MTALDVLSYLTKEHQWLKMKANPSRLVFAGMGTFLFQNELSYLEYYPDFLSDGNI